jgi:hypothetical protein
LSPAYYTIAVLLHGRINTYFPMMPRLFQITKPAHRDRADAGHNLALGQVTVAHQPLTSNRR